VLVRGPAELSGLPAAIGDGLLIGRSADCDLRIPAATVSREHAELSWDAGRLFLVSLTTRSETLVNGEHVDDRRELADGDVIELGGAVALRVELAQAHAVESVTAAPAPSPQPRVGAATEASRAPAPSPASAAPTTVEPLNPKPSTPAAQPEREAPPVPSARARAGSAPSPAPSAERGSIFLAIVGAGPAGIGAAVQAAKRGVPHVLLERGRVAETIERYQKGKQVMAEPQRLDLQRELAVRFAEGTREQVLADFQRALAEARAALRCGREFEVDRIEGKRGAFRLSLRGGETLEASHVVLSIGVQGNLNRFTVPGSELPHVTYQLDDPAAFEGQRIAVFGAGDAGIENAVALANHDNEVFIVNRGDDFPKAKARNRDQIATYIKNRKIVHVENTAVDHFEPGAVFVKRPQGVERIDVDLVIGRLGGNPPRPFLEKLGIAFASQDKQAVPELSPSYESSVPGIFVIGALAGYPLIKNCLNQGFEVVEHILGNPVTPADQPVFAKKFAGIEGSVDEILAAIRKRMPLFRDLTNVQLREFLFDAEVLRCKPGDILYARNEFRTELYAILQGKVELDEPARRQDTDLNQTLARHRTTLSELSDLRKTSLERGDFFGEIEAISGRPREATARATAPTVLLVIGDLALRRLLQSQPAVKAAFDAVFVERTLAKRLPALSAEERTALAAAAGIRRFNPNEFVFEQGKPVDGLHLLRRGSALLVRRDDERERALDILRAGDWIGIAGVLKPGSVRASSARAKVVTETLLLPQAALGPLLARNPALRGDFEKVAAREAAWEAMQQGAGVSGQTKLIVFDRAGGAEATDKLLIDESLCIRCNNCEKACAETHQGVSRLDREAGPTYESSSGMQIHVPTACQHCENPKCMDDCPANAIHRNPNGEVFITDNCIGCGNCEKNCPYGVIQMVHPPVAETKPRGLLWQLLFGSRRSAAHAETSSNKQIAVKCDLCIGLPAPRRGGTAAACVAACPTGAIVRVDPKQFLDELVRER
jgi:Fe-S-cluster-containing dehydrogenase component/thioredoxin reductase/CRP-like cAMP-binding protein